MLLVPVPVWNMLPDHPACSFIGYVTAPSMLVASLVSSGHIICVEKTSKGEVQLEVIKEVDNEGSEEDENSEDDKNSENDESPSEDETSQHWLNETMPSTANLQIVIDTIKQMNPTNKSNFSKDEWESTAGVS